MKRLEDEIQEIQARLVGIAGEWRKDFADLRDERIAFRWIGMPLILLGIAFATWGSLL